MSSVTGKRAARWLAALSAASLALASGAQDPAATPGAFELLERVRETYAGLSSYHDLGEIETTAGPPGDGRTTLRFFETAADAAGNFLWRSHGESEAGFEERVIWSGDAGTFVYSSLHGQYKPLSSVGAELAHALGPGGYEALVVPLLLAGVEDALADPPAAAVDGVEPCGQDVCWVISLSRMAGAVESRLRIERQTSMIREVQVTLAAAPRLPSPGDHPPVGAEPLTLRVRHQQSAQAPPPYRPPAGARQVIAWQAPPVEDRDGYAGDPPSEGPVFSEEITVSLVSLLARIVDSRGEPIRDLTPGDLIAEVDGIEVPIVDLEWWSSDDPRAEIPEAEIAAARDRQSAGVLDVGPGAAPAGKLVVFFLQVDLEPTRIAGHLKILPEVEKLLDGLHPGDRVAIVSFDSHLKLWLDFSRDRDHTFEVLKRAVSYGTPAARRSRGVSLLEHFDRRAAADAATPEVALRRTAEALASLPGEKDLIYLGWGLGRYGVGGVRMTADYEPAVRALGAARATVFVLDVSQADYHSLEVGLQGVAASTGGTYDRTFRFASQVVGRLARTLGGRYRVTLDRTAVPAAHGRLTLRLKRGRGRVLYRPMIFG